MYEQLVKALRSASTISSAWEKLMLDAAAAIEALETEIRESMQKCAECGDRMVEPKRGEWTEENRRPKSAQFVCSICHRPAYDPQPSRDPKWVKRCRYAYCPNCGAKMERGEAET